MTRRAPGGGKHRLELLLEPVRIAAQILEKLEVTVQRRLEPAESAVQVLEVFGRFEGEEGVVASRRRFRQDALAQGRRAATSNSGLRRARRERVEQAPRGRLPAERGG